MIALQLRRSVGAWAFLPLVVAGLYIAYSAMDGGPRMWPISAGAVGMSVQLVGPIAAGAAAYAGSRAARQHTLLWERLSAVGQGRAAGIELAALLFWVALAFAVVIAGVYVPTAAAATWSGPPLLRTLADLLGLLMIVSVAFIAGRVVVHRLVPLAAAVVTYAAITYLRPVSVLRLFSPADIHLYDQFSGPSSPAAASQILWYLGVAGTAVLAWLVRRAIGRAAAVGLVVAMGMAVGGAVLLVGQNGRVYAPQVLDNWECAGTDPQVCIHPANREGAEAVEAQVRGVAQRLRGTPFALARVEQRPRGLGSIPTPGAVAFALDDLRPASLAAVADDAAANALGQTFDRCLNSDGALSDGFSYAQVVAVAVARGTSAPNSASPPEVQQAAMAFGRLDDEARRSWLTEHAQELRSCALSRADFT